MTQSPSGVWLMGTYYGPFNEEDNRWSEAQKFQKHFHSRLWITYRNGFEPILPTQLTTDAGWGCMLRTGQMILAEALLRHYLGSDWRLGYNVKKTVKVYSWLISLFFDQMKSPFSIHQIAITGEQFGKRIGEWFGPATISSVLQSLVLKTSTSPINNFTVYVATDGVVYKNKLAETICGVSNADVFSKEDEPKNFKSVLILIPLRLGLDSINSIYEPALKSSFRFPQSVGISGGRPNASLYFVGVEGDNLLYLDPHFTRPVLPVIHKPAEELLETDLETYHCPDIRRIDITKIDPSLLLGFYCQNFSQVKDFLNRAQNEQGKNPIFSVDDYLPVYNDLVDIQDIEEVEDLQEEGEPIELEDDEDEEIGLKSHRVTEQGSEFEFVTK